MECGFMRFVIPVSCIPNVEKSNNKRCKLLGVESQSHKRIVMETSMFNQVRWIWITPVSLGRLILRMCCYYRVDCQCNIYGKHITYNGIGEADFQSDTPQKMFMRLQLELLRFMQDVCTVYGFIQRTSVTIRPWRGHAEDNTEMSVRQYNKQPRWPGPIGER